MAGASGLTFRLSSSASDGEVLAEVRGLRAAVLKVVGVITTPSPCFWRAASCRGGAMMVAGLDGTTESRSLPGFVLDPSAEGPLEDAVDIAPSYEARSVAVLFDGRVLQWAAYDGRGALPARVRCASFRKGLAVRGGADGSRT